MTYQANKLDKFRLITEKRTMISMLPFTAEKELCCHTKLQTIIIKVVVFQVFIFDSKPKTYQGGTNYIKISIKISLL